MRKAYFYLLYFSNKELKSFNFCSLFEALLDYFIIDLISVFKLFMIDFFCSFYPSRAAILSLSTLYRFSII